MGLGTQVGICNRFWFGDDFHYPDFPLLYKGRDSHLRTLFSPSLCRGITCISEDSSEIMFLLVENYNLTAPWRFGLVLRASGEFLDHSTLFVTLL